MRRAATVVRSAITVGETVGGYRITASLGAGATSTVYVGAHLRTERRVAIKILRPAYARAPERVQRFFAEARAASRVHAPGIVEVLDLGYTQDQLAYVVMELLDGVSLADRLAHQRRLPVALAVNIMRRIAAALAAAHERGAVHRDIRPGNVFLVGGDPIPQVKLLDFGIAGLLDDGARADAGAGRIGGRPMATSRYLSPERCRDGACDRRSDLYSLGCLAFEMIAGRPPFVAGSVFELVTAHLGTPPPDLREHADDAPADLAAIIDRLLAKDPGQRFGTAGELIKALDACIARHGLEPATAAAATTARLPPAPSTRMRRPWRYASAAAVIAGTLGLVRFIAVVDRREAPRPAVAAPASSPAPAVVTDAHLAAPALDLDASIGAVKARPRRPAAAADSNGLLP